MKLLFDEDLVEAVVFLCASGRRNGAPALQIRRFHVAREKLYSILDADQRNAAFFQLHLEWFREWKVEEFLRAVVRDVPLLEQSLYALAFRKARARNEEGAELFVNSDQRCNAIIALRAERFMADEPLRCFLNHELMHVSDMVNPAFGYSPELTLRPALRSSERLVRERYRLLWDVSIDGRLKQREQQTEASRDSRQMEFDRAFAFWPEEKRRETFDLLWLTPQPRHDALMAFACDPRNFRDVNEARPGAPCPLCGFATFDWADVSAIAPETLAMIRAEFTSWREHDGACARCVEVYDAAQRLTQTRDPFLV